MSRQRYSIQESLNRILRSLQGKNPPSDQPWSISPQVLSKDEALSDLAELFAGSLPGQTMFNDNLSGRYAQIYGEGVTGTSQSLLSGTWTSLLGFTDAGEYTDGLVPDPNNNRIFVTKGGAYHISCGLSFTADSGDPTTMHFEINVGGTRYENVSARRGIGATGAIIGNTFTSGILSINAGLTGTSVSVDVRSEEADRILQVFEKRITMLRIGN